MYPPVRGGRSGGPRSLCRHTSGLVLVLKTDRIRPKDRAFSLFCHEGDLSWRRCGRRRRVRVGGGSLWRQGPAGGAAVEVSGANMDCVAGMIADQAEYTYLCIGRCR